MNRYEKVSIIIDADKKDYESLDEFKKISNFLEEYEFNDKQTFSMEIFWYPTYNLLNNEFSFENMISEQKNNKIPYQEYLTESQIKSLSYYDYGGEKIYRLAIQRQEILDWDCINPENLELITKELINYLDQNNLTEFHNETLDELRKLNELSLFCKMIKCEIILFEDI